MPQILTYNQVIQSLKDFAANYPLYFFVGQNWELGQDESVTYPALQVFSESARLVQNSQGDHKTLLVTLNCKVLDVTTQDKKNQTNIQSDTLQIGQDLVNWFGQHSYFQNSNLTIQGDVDFTNLEEFSTDYLTGHEFKINLKLVNHATYCGLPFDDYLAFQQNGVLSTGYTTTISYLTCTTVTGCTILQNYIAANASPARIQPGINTYTGGTATAPTVNVSGATLEYLSATTISAATIWSGQTNLNSIFYGGQGTTNTIPLFSSAKGLGDSYISQTPGTIRVDASIDIVGNVNVLGTATTLNTQTVQTSDNAIDLNLSGTHLTSLYGGIRVLSGKSSSENSTWTIDSSGNWSANTNVYANKFYSAGTSLESIFGTIKGFVGASGGLIPYGTYTADEVRTSNLLYLDRNYFGGFTTRLYVGDYASIGDFAGYSFIVGTSGLNILGGGFNTDGNVLIGTPSTVNILSHYTASSRLCVDGNTFIGGDAVAQARLHVTATTEQLRLGYNGSNYTKSTVDATGAISTEVIGTNAADKFNFYGTGTNGIAFRVINQSNQAGAATSIYAQNAGGQNISISKYSAPTVVAGLIGPSVNAYGAGAGNFLYYGTLATQNHIFALGGTADSNEVLRISTGGTRTTNFSASTFSASTINSGTTNLYQIFAQTGDTALPTYQIGFGDLNGKLSSTSTFKWQDSTQRLLVGGANLTQPLDVGIYRNANGPVGLSIENNAAAASNSASIYLGNENPTAKLAVIARNGTSYVGNFGVSSLPVSDTLQIVNIGAVNASQIIVSQDSIVGFIGSVSGNTGTRLDASGFRVGTLATIHTANTNAFQVEGASSLQSLTASTYVSGTTNLYDIFATTAASQTLVQPGRNISTGGTSSAPTISTVVSPGFTNIVVSGQSSLNIITALQLTNTTLVSATNITGTTVSATTLTAGTLNSAGKLTVLGQTSLQTATATTINTQKIYAGSVSAVPTSAIQTSGSIGIDAAGGGLQIKEGTNATMGTVQLNSGQATVNTTKVTANSRIFLSVNSINTGSIGIIYEDGTRVVGTSFTIKSTNGADNCDVAWLIMEPF